jgi:hypothetical protein
MDEPDHIVIRRAPDMPAEEMPDRLEGWWFDRTQIPQSFALGAPGRVATATPTGRFEVRDYDGAVAEVWEVRW